MEKRTGPASPENPGADEKSNQADIRFGSGMVAVAGVLGGLGIALGGPAVLLSLGQSLGQVVLVILVVLSLAAGALVCLVSAFFGLVIPNHVRSGPWMDPDKWRRFAAERHRRHRERSHWGRRHGAWDGEHDEDGGGDEEAAAPPKRKARR
jgi:hypothetical protein